MGYCHVSRQCDDYAQRIGIEEAKEIALDQRIKSLMQIGEIYDPLEPENFRDGLGNLSDKEIAIISGLIRNGQYQLSAMLMEQQINAYWEQVAKQEIMGVKQ